MTTKISLRTILVIPFVLQILAAVGIIGYLSHHNGQRAVEDLANQLMQEVSGRVSDRLDTHLQKPQEIIAANHFAVQQGTLKIGDFQQLRQQFWQQISLNPSISSSMFLNEAGEGIGYGRLTSEEISKQSSKLTGENLPVGTIYFWETRKDQPDLRKFYLLDSQGQPRKLIYTVNKGLHDYYVKLSQKQAWLPISISRIKPILRLDASIPIRDATGKLQGVFNSNVPLADISTFLHQLKFSPSGQTFIIERATGNLVATSTLEILYTQSAKDQLTPLLAVNSQDPCTREITQHLIKQFGKFPDFSNSQKLILDGLSSQNLACKQRQFVQVLPYQDRYGLDWLIVVAVPESDFMAQIHANTQNTILLCLGAVGVAIAFGTLTGAKITRTLQQLSRASQKIAAGELDCQIPSEIPIKELDAISVSFNLMSQQLRESFERGITALQESKERYSIIFRTSPDPISITTLTDGQFIEVNQSFLNLNGYTRAEVIGRSAAELNLIVNIEEVSAIVQQLQATGMVNNHEFHCRIKSGEVKIFLVSSELIELDGQLYALSVSKEISNLKQIENQLRQALQELTYHVNNSPLATIEWDQEFQIRQWSQQAEKIFGWTAAEVLGKHFNDWKFVYQADREQVNQITGWLLDRTEDHNISCNRNYTKNGRVIDCEWYNSVLLNDSGKLISVLSLVHDITDRKQTEAKLLESKRLTEQVIESSAAILYIFDIIEQQNVYVNSQMERLLGYSASEIQAMGSNMFSTLIHPDDLPGVIENGWRCLSLLDGEWIETEYRMHDTQGNWHWLCSRDSVLSRTADGQPKELLGTAIDLTDRKQLEIALQQSETKFSTIFHTSPDPMWIATLAEGRCLTINDSLVKFSGFSRSEIIGKTCLELELWDKIEDLQHFRQILLTEGSLQNFEVVFRPRSREAKTILLSAQVSRIADQDCIIGLLKDISDRKQIEQALELQAVIVRNMAEGICLVKADCGILVYTNPKFEQMFGYDPNELNGQHISIVNCISDQVISEELIRVALLQDGETTYEVHNLKKDGTPFWCSVTASVFQHPEYGDVVVAVYQDITARKQAESTLRQQTRYKYLVAEITNQMRRSLDLDEILAITVKEVQQTLYADRVLIFQLHEDGSGSIVKESVLPEYPVTEKMQWLDECFPSDCYEFYAQGNSRIVPDVATDEWGSCLTEFMQQVGVKSKVVAPIVQIVEGSDCPRVWGLLVAHACDHHRQWQAVEADLLNRVTDQLAIAIQQSELYKQLQMELQERKQTEATLREAERRWGFLLDNVQLLVVGLDQMGAVNYANPFFLKLTGYPESAALGKNWLKTFVVPANRQQVQAIFSTISAANPHLHYQHFILTKSGEERYIAWNNTLLRDLAGNIIGTISIGEDITEQQKIEQIKNEFIGIVSHELRTPLTAIRASLGLLKTGIYHKKPEKFNRMIEIALNDSQRLVRLVNDILDLERLDSGRSVLEKTICQAADLIKQAVQGVQAIAHQQRITLDIYPTDVEVWAADDAIVQTLTNLLSNAIKFSPPDSTIIVSVEEQIDRALFQVRDHGRGIPEDKLEGIFERFQQVDASDSRQKGGTGLGLAICRSIIEQHDGEIWAESTFGIGSTFFFTLPRSPDKIQQ